MLTWWLQRWSWDSLGSSHQYSKCQEPQNIVLELVSCFSDAVILVTSVLRHKVEPNQEFHGLVCEGANVLPSKFLEDAFRDGYGRFSITYSLQLYLGHCV